MDRDNMRILRIMEEVESKNSITQRELADRLNISVGMTNLFIKRIIKKGYFKVTTIPGRRILYALTPKGFAEKARLTKEYLQYSLGYYKSVRNKITERLAELEQRGVGEIAVFGVGEISELIALLIRDTGLGVSGIIDRGHAGERFYGFEVRSPIDFLKERYDYVLIASFEDGESLRDELTGIGYDRRKIMLLS